MKMALVLSIEYSIKHAFSILTQMVACLLPLISVGILAIENKITSDENKTTRRKIK